MINKKTDTQDEYRFGHGLNLICRHLTDRVEVLRLDIKNYKDSLLHEKGSIIKEYG